MSKYFIYLIIMAGVTYVVRMLPITLFQKEITNIYVKSFLYYKDLKKDEEELLAADDFYNNAVKLFVNGDFSAAGEVIVGADGYGIIEMIGKDGSFTAGNMVLSNAASSVVRFVSGADGFSPINVTNLTVTDGTRIEVDLSDYAGSANKHRLFNAASLNGDFDDVEIVVRDSNGVVNSPYMFKKSETAVDLYFIIGTTIIIR